ncbi:MAG: biotin--[acetyl-CoA-carboxylase] ligase [Actinomycetes bacterium]
MTADQPRVATPLDPAAIQAALERHGCPWRTVISVAETGSTNADLVARVVGAGSSDGFVLVSDVQHAGRGRLDRSWQAPPGTALTFSVALHLGDVPHVRWPWLPLLAGVAVHEAVGRLSGLPVGLKWPNDLMLEGGLLKIGGILVEVAGSASTAIVGIGINVGQAIGELPVPTAGSLAVAGAVVDRIDLLAGILAELAAGFEQWRACGGDPAAGLRASYLSRCLTLGQEVLVSLPDRQLRGLATDIDSDGRLVVCGIAVSAGDVEHVRPV